MPTILTIWLAKLILNTSRALGRGGGSALPGLVAEKIDPGIGRKLARRLADGSIIITGTNGKTTTAKMVAQVLNDAGHKLVANRAGSNLSRGVVSALIEHANWRGRLDGELGLFEVDEAAMPAVSAMLQPRAIMVLNLFRDQLDRYGELDTTAGLIGRGIAGSEAEVYLNADDPLVASLAKYTDESKVHYFGVSDVPAKKLAHDVTADSTNCPICSRALKYSKTFFGHMGHYSCTEGHFDRPNPAVLAEDVTLGDAGSTLAVNTGTTKSLDISLQLPGVYNIYNAAAAVALSLELGVPREEIAESLAVTEAAFGRVEKVGVGDKQLYLLLIKNPTGFNQIIQTFLLQKQQQKILFLINDNFADGRDVSWLWDVALEELEPMKHDVSSSGIRASDMALRLKYAGVPTSSVEEDAQKAVDTFIAGLAPDEIGYIVPTYTAMLAVRKHLGTKVKLAENWA